MMECDFNWSRATYRARRAAKEYTGPASEEGTIGPHGIALHRSQLRQQLAEADAILEKMTVYGTPDFASEIALRSFQQHRQELLDEIKEWEAKDSRPTVGWELLRY